MRWIASASLSANSATYCSKEVHRMRLDPAFRTARKTIPAAKPLTLLVSGNRKVTREAHGWLMLGAEGFCYDVSESFARMLKQPKSSILAHNWFHLVYVEDRDKVRK